MRRRPGRDQVGVGEPGAVEQRHGRQADLPQATVHAGKAPGQHGAEQEAPPTGEQLWRRDPSQQLAKPSHAPPSPAHAAGRPGRDSRAAGSPAVRHPSFGEGNTGTAAMVPGGRPPSCCARGCRAMPPWGPPRPGRTLSAPWWNSGSARRSSVLPARFWVRPGTDRIGRPLKTMARGPRTRSTGLRFRDTRLLVSGQKFSAFRRSRSWAIRSTGRSGAARAPSPAPGSKAVMPAARRAVSGPRLACQTSPRWLT